MLEAKTQDELVRIIEAVKKKARFKGLKTGDEIKIAGISFGSQLSTDSKYAWTNHHQTISYNGEVLDIKVPTLLGRAVVKIRYIDEKFFNGSFIVPESSSQALSREANVYEKLTKHNFPTLQSAQELIKHSGELLVDNILLTKKIENPKYTIDLISTSGTAEAKKYIKDITTQMKILHQEHNQIWGDAWLGNTMINSEGKILLYDFGFKANPEKSQSFLRAKDLVSLCISAVYRTGQNPEPIIELIMETYEPDKLIKDQIKTSMEKKLARKGLIIPKIEEIMYFNPVYGMNKRSVEKVRREMYTHATKLPVILLAYMMK